jgi:hypothetical protein
MSFFNEETNPFVKMFNQLPPEDKEKYTKMGDYIYSIVDFETGEIIQDPNAELESIRDALRSGLSIDDLTEKERELIRHHGCDIDNILANGN